MDKQSGKMPETPQMPQAPKELQGLRLLPFDELDDSQKGQLLKLQYNPLDTRKNKNLEFRKESIKADKLHHEHLKGDAHGDVVVAVDGEDVLGILTLNRSEGVGIIDDIWLAGEHHQDAILFGLLELTKERLRDGAVRCDRAMIKADHPSEDMRRVYHHVLGVDSRTFFSFESKDN